MLWARDLCMPCLTIKRSVLLTSERSSVPKRPQRDGLQVAFTRHVSFVSDIGPASFGGWSCQKPERLYAAVPCMKSRCWHVGDGGETAFDGLNSIVKAQARANRPGAFCKFTGLGSAARS